jgi:hypothetical protein
VSVFGPTRNELWAKRNEHLLRELKLGERWPADVYTNMPSKLRGRCAPIKLRPPPPTRNLIVNELTTSPDIATVNVSPVAPEALMNPLAQSALLSTALAQASPHDRFREGSC